MSIVVDFPAPLGPSSATVSPPAIETSIPRTARTGPAGPRQDFTSPRSSIAWSDPIGTRGPVDVASSLTVSSD